MEGKEVMESKSVARRLAIQKKADTEPNQEFLSLVQLATRAVCSLRNTSWRGYLVHSLVTFIQTVTNHVKCCEARLDALEQKKCACKKGAQCDKS